MTKTQKLTYLSIVCFATVLFNCVAQQSPTASGGDATGTNGSVSYSVGQIVYLTSSGSNGSISEGVQQPFEISEVLGSEDFSNLITDIKIYPNPSTDVLTLNLINQDNLELDYQIIDNNGKLLTSDKIIANETNIDVAALPSSIYYLKITNVNKEVKTYKIIKK